MITISYVAGFFDADGCVHFHKISKCWQLIFSNDNKEVLESIAKILNVSNKIRTIKRKKGKTGYDLRISQWRDIRRIGLLMRPYLTVKKEKIEKMLKFIDSHNQCRGNYTLLDKQFLAEHRHLTGRQLSVIMGRTVQSIHSARHNYKALRFTGNPGIIGPQIREAKKIARTFRLS